MDIDSLLPERNDEDDEEEDKEEDEQQEEEEDDDEENGLEMRTYTVGELLGHTVQSYKDRGWDNDENSDSDGTSGSRDENNQKKKPRKKTVVGGRGTAEKKKRQCRRVWTPDGEYALVKTGPPLLMENPDDCIADMSHLSLTIFKHNDPDVRFGEDPDRPLWKGVFRMAVGGYGKDEYYDPKHSHLKRIYSVDFPKNKRPANNLQVRRDGVTELPYWVDAWHHAKLAEEGYKQKSKKKTLEKGRMQQAVKGDLATVVPPVENVIFPLVGWFKTNLAKRAKIPDPSGGYPYTLALPAETAKKSVKLVKDMIAKIGPVGTQPIAPPPPPAPAPSLKKERVVSKEQEDDLQEPLPKKKKAAAASDKPKASEKKKRKGKPEPTKKDDKEQQEEEEATTKRAKPDASENLIQQQQQQANQPVRVPDSQRTIMETMQGFFNAASAGMAAPGTFYYQALYEQQASFDSFFGPGGPGDCVLPIVQMLLKKIGNK